VKKKNYFSYVCAHIYIYISIKAFVYHSWYHYLFSNFQMVMAYKKKKIQTQLEKLNLAREGIRR
jgi:hypothetical protein